MPLPRFTLRTLLIVVAVCAVALVVCRPTDPNLARRGMTKAVVWWYCGWPDDTDELGWWYSTRDLSSVYVVFDEQDRARLVYFNK